ncbi:unnamed protein product [Paramecium pentaurelia]|uniref:Transmembrane protein n=1 Tax=Paramecium pentaurelia TaxID=43138 RepID=A0A8S1XSY5_9CILI|nr:unnamed protein product [Paramecium pentaurelia]
MKTSKSLYLEVVIILLVYGSKIKIIYGVCYRYQMDIIQESLVQFQIQMKIQLYQGVMIKQLIFGQRRMNGSVYKQLLIIQILYQD